MKSKQEEGLGSGGEKSETGLLIEDCLFFQYLSTPGGHVATLNWGGRTGAVKL